MTGLFLAIIGLTSVRAQEDRRVRCEVIRTETGAYFEQWLSSARQNRAVSESIVYRIPVVVHILHTGEPVGEGFNFSDERIVTQIRTLNEDFRRKEGTPGFNAHPDGADTHIEFFLAQTDPQGNPTSGIVRINRSAVPPPSGPSDLITLSSAYSYWNPEHYLNIWCWDVGFHGIYFGKSTFPVSNLKGLSTEDLTVADGLFINAINFGRGEDHTLPNYDGGRTLTHEMGHFLGLLHTFGPANDCDYSDYCEDTPPQRTATNGCPQEKPFACDGRPVMIENYMDYSYDRCMNIFTREQSERMHVVLENSPRRKSLVVPGIVTANPDNTKDVIAIYPNPAKDRFYLSGNKESVGEPVNVKVLALTGEILFEKVFVLNDSEWEILLPGADENVAIVCLESTRFSLRQLMIIHAPR